MKNITYQPYNYNRPTWQRRWKLGVRRPRNHATKSRGLLNPPFLFIYCLYLRFNTTWTSPSTLSSTFLPFVVSKSQNPIILSISCSSGVLPSRSAGVTIGRSPKVFFGLTKDVEGPGDVVRERRRRGEGLRRRSGDRRRRSRDRERDRVRGLRLSRSLSRSRSLSLSRRLSSRRRGLGERPILTCSNIFTS